MKFKPMRIRLRDRLSEETIRSLDPHMWALVMDAEIDIGMDEPSGGSWSAIFKFKVTGNEAWQELEKLLGEEGKPRPKSR